MLTRRQLEEREEKTLAPYAVLSGRSAGRVHKEAEDEYRTCFQRDRDRIIHSKAFRRLAGKTQVFVATFGDHYRDRLSHTLEVAQVSRDLARGLALNEDLAEAIALAHDIGHTPFGHAGESTLDGLMKKFGLGFEHNQQSRRIVEYLEDRYPTFPGLNLSSEVLSGLAKHQTHYDQSGIEISGKTMEAQIVDLSDEIAYNNHDIDDGLRSKLFRLADLSGSVGIFRDAEKLVLEQYGILDEKYSRHRIISALMKLMTADVFQESDRRLTKYGIDNLGDVIACPEPIAAFSESFQQKMQELRKFLWDRMYQSPQVLSHSNSGQEIIRGLFQIFMSSPDLLPEKLREKIKSGLDSTEIIVKDYVSGMTDSFALSQFRAIANRAVEL